MKSLSFYSTHTDNVGLYFHNHNKKAIENIRQLLFSNLRKYHPSVAIAVREVLNNRIKAAPSPLLGELYPHLLNDLLGGIDQKVFTEISAQWLAAYVLTTMIDSNCDVGAPLHGVLIAPLQLEASKLYMKTTGTKYSAMFEKLVFEAVRGQISDTNLQKNKGAWDAKIVAARDKNKILSAFSVVIATVISDKQQAGLAINLSDNFLLSYQLLDDLADFHSDYLEGNSTLLLSKIEAPIQVGHDSLLNEVIISGTMTTALEIILESLSKGIAMIEKNRHTNKLGSSYSYFKRLEKEVSVLNELVKEYRLQRPSHKRLSGLINKQIRIVCQST